MIQIWEVQQVIPHPKYNHNTHNYDLMPLRLKNPLQINETLKTIGITTCLNLGPSAKCLAGAP